MIEFENPSFLLFIPVMIIVLALLIHHDFVEGFKKKRLRIFVFFSRMIIFSLLILVLSAPYTSTTRVEKGDTTVNVLIDRSKSMELFEDDTESLVSSLSGLDGVSPVIIADGFKSPIGSAILSRMLGNDNILLVTDGNSNSGKELGDIMKLAAFMNSTVNAVQLSPKETDFSVSIEGPKFVLSGLENSFYLVVKGSGKKDYTASLAVDGKEMLSFSGSGPASEELKLSLDGGFHKMQAELKTADYNGENNLFYKVVSSLEKPKVLFVSSKESPVKKIFQEMYELDAVQEIPDELGSYFGVILDDVPASAVDKKTELLTNYVLEGNGLFVIGGKSSYDYGGYETSQFQSLLPVKVGSPSAENITNLNIVLVVDISLSTGLGAMSGSVVDVEKAQALSIFNQLAPDDYLSVIAFNNEAHILSELSKVEGQLDTPKKISSLKDTGGTYLETGLASANDQLLLAEGNKNIVVISDGKTKNPETVLELARHIKAGGARVYAVGVGPGTDEAFMGELAFAGGGAYLKADAVNQLGLIFGEERSDDIKEWKVIPLSQSHFITKGLEIDGKIYGYNQVVPKSSAQLLASTTGGLPVLAVWRFGLGRVVSLSTDGGEYWAGSLLKEGSSRLISRASNWAVGDPRRKQSIRVSVDDGFIMDELEFKVYSDKTPVIEDVQLTETDSNVYSGSMIPDAKGFFSVLGEQFAVNYPREYKDIGVNPELGELVEITGGEMLSPEEPGEIIEKIKKDSEKIVEDRNYFRQFMLPFAIALFLAEIFVRRQAKKE
jgi:uncharacterized membrane protein